ncbi:MAG: hypothetical protein Unbinned6224contig1000_73 [Prokaryotic dsDNA virus sp.]|nr:MAG: hypothetical protein Unbinned6224contig1000_73 [Prokaryotic dsDNA virus sp.]|tara:strand:+ start:119 stop:532 length:414 start_codon:yes stop_codon:yes gene_type:complete
MKTTKHILNLAEALVNEDIKTSDFWTEKDKPQLTNWKAEELQRIKNALLKGKFYAGVESVSKSGRSRTIKLAYIYKNKLHKIGDKEILSLAGVSENGRISGCGMDMLFHAQYTLFHNLHKSYKAAHYQKRMPQYNNL